MKKLTVVLALILSFLLGILYTIKNVQPGYDDGFYLLSIFGHTWCYADSDYIICDDCEWQLGEWYDENFEYIEEYE